MAADVRTTSDEAVKQVDANLRKLRTLCLQWSAILSSDVTGERVAQNLLGVLRAQKTRLLLVNETNFPGITAQAQSYRGGGYDIVAECAALVLLIDAAIATIQGVNVSVLLDSWGLDTLVWATFPSSNPTVIQLKADLDAIVAEIQVS